MVRDMFFGSVRRVLMDEVVRTIAVVFAFGAAMSSQAQNPTWVGDNDTGTGTWSTGWRDGDTVGGCTGGTLYFEKPVNNIDMNGITFEDVWTFRAAEGSSFSEANRCAVNIYNTSATDSKLPKLKVFYSPRSEEDKKNFKNMVVTFGGPASIGNVLVTTTKNGSSDGGINSFALEDDSHIVFAEKSSYSETVSRDNVVGGAYATSNSLTVTKGGIVTMRSVLAIATNATSVGVVNVTGGTLSITVSKDIVIGQNGTGTLIVDDGGMVEVPNSWLHCGKMSGSAGKILLRNCGLIKTKIINSNASTGAIEFDGGTVRVFGEWANAGKTNPSVLSKMDVTIGTGGGTIQTGERANIGVTIASDVKGPGGMTFTGGGTLTFNQSVSYFGATAVTPGTAVGAVKEAARDNILAHGLVVAGIPTPGQMVFTNNFDLTGADISKVTCSLAPTTTFRVGGDGNRTILVDTVGPAIDNYWTGAAGDNNLSTAGNWSNGVPSGNANILCPDPVTLTKGDSFAPTSITFLEGCAHVTIEGGDFMGIVAITNLSTIASHTFKSAVHFAGDIQVSQAAMDDLAKTHVTFAGGAYAAAGCSLESGDSESGYSRCIFGKYFLANSADNPWTAMQSGSMSVRLAENAKLYVPHAGQLGEICIGTNANVTVGDMLLDGGRISRQNYGEFIVTNLVVTGSGDRGATYKQGASAPGVFKFNTITNSMTDNWFYFADLYSIASNYVFYIGEGGLNFSGTKAVCSLGRNVAGNTLTIRPWHSDFTITDRSGSSAALIIQRSVTFCTDDENGEGRTIILDTATDSRCTPEITVSGTGRLKVNKAARNPSVEPPVTVTDSATLEYASGANLGTGAMSVDGGATFAVGGSSTVTLSDLTLGDGATLAFNFTARGITPAIASTSVSAVGAVKVKVSATGINKPRGGEHVLTTGGGFNAEGVTVSLDEGSRPDWATGLSVNGDGNIVLNVRFGGFTLSVR